MAHVVNPYNLDDDDDDVFSALLMEGLIWIEDDGDVEDVIDDDETNVPETNLVYTQRVLQEAAYFIGQRGEEWVSFNRVNNDLNKKFGKVDLKRLEKPSKEYKSLVNFGFA